MSSAPYTPAASWADYTAKNADGVRVREVLYSARNCTVAVSLHNSYSILEAHLLRLLLATKKSEAQKADLLALRGAM